MNRSFIQASKIRRISNWHSLATICNEVRAALICKLLRPSGPATITRFISKIVVNAIYRHFVWWVAHIN